MAVITEVSPPLVARRRSRFRWAWFGVVGGVAGFAATVLTDPQASLSDAQRHTNEQVLALVHHTGYQVGAILGLLATGCVLVAAAGWRRWARHRGGDDLAAAVVPGALVASAGAMIIAFGFKGDLAIYLPGGFNASEFNRSSLYPLFLVNKPDAVSCLVGVTVAAAAVAVLGLRRVLPVWTGVVSLLAVLPPMVFLVTTGLTAYAGIVGPRWLGAAATAPGRSSGRGCRPSGAKICGTQAGVVAGGSGVSRCGLVVAVR